MCPGPPKRESVVRIPTQAQRHLGQPDHSSQGMPAPVPPVPGGPAPSHTLLSPAEREEAPFWPLRVTQS